MKGRMVNQQQQRDQNLMIMLDLVSMKMTDFILEKVTIKRYLLISKTSMSTEYQMLDLIRRQANNMLIPHLICNKNLPFQTLLLN